MIAFLPERSIQSKIKVLFLYKFFPEIKIVPGNGVMGSTKTNPLAVLEGERQRSRCFEMEHLIFFHGGRKNEKEMSTPRRGWQYQICTHLLSE